MIQPHVPGHLGPASAKVSARQPVDRDPVVCHPDLEELLQAWPAELPDQFFEVTVDDVRRRLAQLKSERWVCPAPLSSLLHGRPWRVGSRQGLPSPVCQLQLVWGLHSGWGDPGPSPTPSTGSAWKKPP